MKYLFLLVTFTILMTTTTAIQKSCKDIYRCTQEEYCLNGWCVPNKGRNGNQMRMDESSSKNARKLFGISQKKLRCRSTDDCEANGFGSVCSSGYCRQLF